MKNKLIKMLPLILCLVLVLTLFSGCPPYELTVSTSGVLTRYNIIFSTEDLPLSKTGLWTTISMDEDSRNRTLHRVAFTNASNYPPFVLYLITYSETPNSFKFNPSTALYFEKDKRKDNDEKTQAFLESNNWNDKKTFADRKNLIELNKSGVVARKSEEISKRTLNPNLDQLSVIGTSYLVEKTGITNAIFGNAIIDEYCRHISGFYFFDEELQDYRLFAVCFIGFFDKHIGYYSDTPIMEIDLDNYLEDLATFKKLNNWGEPITVEEIEALPKYVAEELDVTPTETPSETPATT